MKKITTTHILIAILLIAVGILIYLLVFPVGVKTVGPENSKPAQVQLKKTTMLSFNPEFLNISTTSASTSVDLMANTNGDEISGIQADLKYDPTAITNVQITPVTDGLFGKQANVLFKEVDSKNGTISFAVAISPGGKALAGKDKIATITFQKASVSQAPSTTITFTSNSLVTKPGQSASVLKETLPLNITRM